LIEYQWGLIVLLLLAYFLLNFYESKFMSLHKYPSKPKLIYLLNNNTILVYLVNMNVLFNFQ